MTTCNCSNHILLYLKYSKPDDFCSKEKCLEWGELNICEFCNTKYCDDHLCIIIKCFCCDKKNCVNNIINTDWVKMSGDISTFACSDCRHSKYFNSLKSKK